MRITPLALRPSALLLAAALSCAATGLAQSPPAGGGFDGAWSLVSSKDDVAAKAKKGLWDVARGMPGDSKSGGFDIPLEVMTDARRLVVTDDGTTLKAVYPAGRKRAFVTDGRERYVDDGDGPANVTARRKGTVVTVASEWFRGYRLRETWEVRDEPRRLVVTGKLTGRSSQEYVRTYEPGPLVEPTPTPAPTPATAAATIPGAEPPAFVDRLSECTARPPRNARDEELRPLVRVAQEAASKSAVASVAPAKPTDVISSDAEVFEGCLVWPFTLRLPGLGGVQEVFVDAGDGKIVRSEFVPTGGPTGPTP